MKLQFITWDYGFAIGFGVKVGHRRQGVTMRRRIGRYPARPRPTPKRRAKARRVLQQWARSIRTPSMRPPLLHRRT